MHNHDGIQIYITGPLFNTHERWYLEHIAAAHEAAGYCTFLPHRDAGLLGQVTLERRLTLFYDDLAALEHSDLVVALLTGPDQDSCTPEKVDGIPRIQWTAWIGFTGRHAPDSVVDMDRITHLIYAMEPLTILIADDHPSCINACDIAVFISTSTFVCTPRYIIIRIAIY